MSLYFGREVRTRLGVAIFVVSWPLVIHIKMGTSRQVFARGHKRTCGLVLHNLHKMPSAKQGSCEYHFLKSFGMA